jgi:hypothetical protein
LGRFRADFRLWRDFRGSSGNISQLQTFEADIAGFEFGFIPHCFSCFDCNSDFNYLNINILIQIIMNTTENSINQIITALLELEAKGCHRIFFEYGNGLFRVRIFKGDVKVDTVVYERTVNVVTVEQLELEELANYIHTLTLHITSTIFQCYKREYIKGEKAGKWEKTGSTFEFGTNATSEMLINGAGYYITAPDNQLQYFVDMQQASETEK